MVDTTAASSGPASGGQTVEHQATPDQSANHANTTGSPTGHQFNAPGTPAAQQPNASGASTAQQSDALSQNPGQTLSPPVTAGAVNAGTLLAPPQTNPALFGEGLMSSPFSSMVVPTVLGVLIFFSIITWAVLLIKSVQFIRFRRQNKRFASRFWESGELAEGWAVAQKSRGSLSRLANIGVDVLSGNDISAHRRELAKKINRGERMERSLRQQIQTERRSLESGLTILASIGSTAPFIGLFGTVWGIMEALIRIGASGEAGLGSVAGPIGHALIATGIGIAAAVPAVLVYNYFIRNLKLATGDMESFAEEFYSLAQETGFYLDGQDGWSI
ncbi:MotA/TolQ/ExbB proton channel family protein [Sodalis ligni]|uniref:Biopolymer transport protein ExbB/TolQ n=1 Tax=Sodalis ligni TaxID=2697027 RepID=A0A4R1NPG6_9GAMM|nr:MotA/TolQ/ExbB proton channel family protein [Sodalis ligni]TCL06260.1 biopolymer transport protein ExbB/TolQ [Sodalis ligni]